MRRHEEKLREAYRALEVDRRKGVGLLAFADYEADQAYRLGRRSDAARRGEIAPDNDLRTPALDLLVGSTHVLCSLPDDPLDTAKFNLEAKIEDLADRLDTAARSALANVDADGLGMNLEAVNLWLRARGTSEEERAEILANDMGNEVAKRSDVAKQLVEDALKKSRTATRDARWSARLTDASRILALLGVASLSWAVGFLANNFSLAVQVLLAAALFIVLDRLLVERMLDPWLKRIRRRRLTASARQVADQFRVAAEAVTRVKRLTSRDD